MKIILGDNQFFGINHNDLKKGELSKNKFENISSIKNFINESLKLGLDGFMINSNEKGYKVASSLNIVNKEVHYSIPYPHKYASIVNEKGMLNLMYYFLKNTSLLKLIRCVPMFFLTRNLKYLIPIATSLEIPKGIPKGSTIYLQNILTDLILGIGRIDFLEAFAKDMLENGYKVGLITLNPILLNSYIKRSKILNSSDLIVCFNINSNGFNVFPSVKKVEEFALDKKKYKLMGMSIFSSGGGNIQKCIKYIKNFNLDYIVFGSSKIKNVKSNYDLFKKI